VRLYNLRERRLEPMAARLSGTHLFSVGTVFKNKKGNTVVGVFSDKGEKLFLFEVPKGTEKFECNFKNDSSVYALNHIGINHINYF
jgi:hypothetical protein